MKRKTWNYNGHELPEKYITVIVLLKWEDIPPIPAIGFIAETIDTMTPYFHCPVSRRGYDISLILKWDYLSEVCPGYAL